MLAGIKAIETRYAGILFRSRLEARWAVFFDALDRALCGRGPRWLDWQYEPEGFELESGWYLPDFRLTTSTTRVSSVWIEVKPEKQQIDPRWQELARKSGQSVVLLTGIPKPRDIGDAWRGIDSFCAGCGQPLDDVDGSVFCSNLVDANGRPWRGHGDTWHTCRGTQVGWPYWFLAGKLPATLTHLQRFIEAAFAEANSARF
jgi:hypothetical protein